MKPSRGFALRNLNTAVFVWPPSPVGLFRSLFDFPVSTVVLKILLVLQSAGIHFPGAVDLSGTTFESLGKDPIAAWAALPDGGKWQMIFAIGTLLAPPWLRLQVQA